MLSVKKKKIIAAWYMYRKIKLNDKIVQRRYWIHPLLQERQEFGTFHVLVKRHLLQHERKFGKYFRMQKKTFEKLLNILYLKLKHEDTYMRDSITPAERLAVTLRYLATGNSLVDMEFQYRIGLKTLSRIIREVCYHIWTELFPEYMPIPSKEEWLKIAKQFELYANFPNCLGAVDGKHIRVIKPAQSGSMFLNYKHYFSIVLLAVVDAKYNFTYINVGAYGKECDSSIFKESSFWKSLQNNDLNIPEDRLIAGYENGLPYVFVGDEAFALHKHLMRPYGGRDLDRTKRIFNYRLTRARRFVECAFGIMSNKWRIFHRPMNLSTDLSINVVQACCVLQNFIHKNEGLNFATSSTSTFDSLSELMTLRRSSSVRGSLTANDIRSKFAEYFVSERGRVPWQDQYS